jgi:lipoyl-dependent peroxiredoxin
MAKRKASAVWEGTLREGKGRVKLGSGAFTGQYSFASRFEEGVGTNPEELIGAAHAGCFSMALAAGLTKAGLKPTRISTTAQVSLEKVGEGFKITTIELEKGSRSSRHRSKRFSRSRRVGQAELSGLAGPGWRGY